MNDIIRFCAEMEAKSQKVINGKAFSYSVAREQGKAEIYHYMAEILSEAVDGNIAEANRLMATLWDRD